MLPSSSYNLAVLHHKLNPQECEKKPGGERPVFSLSSGGFTKMTLVLMTKDIITLQRIFRYLDGLR